jgi:hypothetical protein
MEDFTTDMVAVNVDFEEMRACVDGHQLQYH